METYRRGSLGHILRAAVFGCLLVSGLYAANPVPTVTGPVQPQAVKPGRGDFTLTVYGAGFVAGAVVNWNGSPRSTTFISARQVRAQILASDVAQPTAGYITVTNPSPGGGNSSSSSAIVEVHKPTATIVPGQPHYYTLGFDPMGFLVTSDFNGDGKLDLLGAGFDHKVYLLLGNGDGTFRHPSIASYRYSSGGDFPDTLAVGDFNGDGKLDFVFSSSRTPPDEIEVRLGNGDGAFRTSWRFGKYDGSPNFAVGDFNGDGNLDLAVVVATDFAVHIFLGNGDGTFREGASYGNLPGVFSPLAADFNGDGKLDLVVDTEAGILLLLGNGDGTFQSPRTIVKNRAGETAFGCGYGVPVVVNDFNEDGKMFLPSAMVHCLNHRSELCSAMAMEPSRSLSTTVLAARMAPTGRLPQATLIPTVKRTLLTGISSTMRTIQLLRFCWEKATARSNGKLRLSFPATSKSWELCQATSTPVVF